jgi:hypothetical protein
LHAHHEEKHSADGQETPDVVDLGKDLFTRKTLTVHTRRRVIEDCGYHQTDESPIRIDETSQLNDYCIERFLVAFHLPDSAEASDPSPRRVVGD